MYRLLKFTFLFALVFYKPDNADAQCTIISSCGYSVTINVKALSIIPSSTSCASGYNYNVRFGYTITIAGVNTCFNGNVGVQPQILCNSQNNGYFTISNPAPTVGAGASSSTYSGTLTTTTNPFRSATDCNSATPASLNCNSLQVTIFGPGISTTTYSCNLNTLPIELYEFYSLKTNNSVHLKWSTASELNNHFFTLERSSDAVNWLAISTVEGAGTSLTAKDYQSFDYSYTKSLNYYRLKQTDFDGSFEYSDIVLVDMTHTESSISVFPNPVSDVLIIDSDSETLKTLELTDMQGRLVAKQIQYKSGRFDMGTCEKGMYILKVFDEKGITCFKVLKN